MRVLQSRLQVKRGKYGSSKVRAFTCLLDGNWTSRQLCVLAGIGYHSLGRALPKWVGFGYVTRQHIDAFGAGDYVYQLEPKAKKWLRLAAQYLPHYRKFMAELHQWQEYMMPFRDELLSMPFSEFVATLDVRIKQFKEQLPGK